MIWYLFRVDERSTLPLWIPAFAGMTVAECVERSHEV